MMTVYSAHIGSQSVPLPVVGLSDTMGIALLITVDHGVRFCAQAGAELAERLVAHEVDVVVSVATMGIPLAIETTKSLGLDDYVILHKTRKIHLADGEWEPVRSITTDAPQALGLDRARLGALEGRRVAIIDDVISTGSSMIAALALVRRVGGQPVMLGCLATEGSQWRTTLEADARLVVALGSLPLFRPDGLGGWRSLDE
jgi:adenine phosphoribosyltransferase